MMSKMSDLISRQAAIDAILDLTDFVSVINLFEYVEEHDLQDKRSGGIIDAIDAVLLLPSAQPERKTGHWLKVGEDDRMQIIWNECSECGQPISWMPHFCPGCGAYMRGEKDE